MKVYEALARAFAEEGTSAVFGLMGHSNQEWIDSLVQREVAVYEVRHEGAGVAMAEGWARINGQPGVCTATSGPGTAQLATGLLVASRARTPLVAFCGDEPLGELPRHDDAGSQRLNQERFAEATECRFVRITSADNAHEAVQQAFYQARLGSCPVMLSVPMDVQQQSIDDWEEYRPSTSLMTRGLMHPDAKSLETAIEIILRSGRIVVVAGLGAIKSQAGAAIVELANRTGALVATSLPAMNWLRDRYDFHAGISGLYSTRTALELFQEADCVIGVGASLNVYTTEGGYIYPNATIVQFDTRPQVVMGNGTSAACYVQSDARIGIEHLNRILDDRAFLQAGFRTPEVKEALASALDDPDEFEIEAGTVDPREVCRILDEIMPSNFGLVTGSGNQSNISGMLFTRPRVFTLVNKSFGCIGQGMTGAIGAVIASDRTPAFLMEGDISAMMYLTEFETAVRYEIPLLMVVLNNQCLASEVLKAELKGLNQDLARIPTPDLGAVGNSLGGRGRLVRTTAELREAAGEFVASPGPMILDVRISPNVLAIQYRRKYRGQENV